MTCKLFLQSGKEIKYAGEFRNRETARKHFELIRPQLRSELGQIVTAIYVESGKGRGK